MPYGLSADTLSRALTNKGHMIEAAGAAPMSTAASGVTLVLSMISFSIAGGIRTVYDHFSSRAKMHDFAALAIQINNAVEREGKLTLHSEKHGTIEITEEKPSADAPTRLCITVDGETSYIENMTLAGMKKNVLADMVKNHSMYYPDDYSTNNRWMNLGEYKSMLENIGDNPDAIDLDQFKNAFNVDITKEQLLSLPRLKPDEVDLLLRIEIARRDKENEEYLQDRLSLVPSGRESQQKVANFAKPLIQHHYRPDDNFATVNDKPDMETVLTEQEIDVLKEFNHGDYDPALAFSGFSYTKGGNEFGFINPLVALSVERSPRDSDSGTNMEILNEKLDLYQAYNEDKAQIDSILTKIYNNHHTLNVKHNGNSRNDIL
jgi:hypothetical protein